MEKPKIFDEPSSTELASKLINKMTKQEYADLLNLTHKVDLESIPSYILSALVRFYDDKHNSGR